MRNANWLFIYRQAPTEKGLTQDALDFMLVAAAFGVNINVIFVGDGVKHVLFPKGGSAESKVLPSFVKTFGALDDFEISQVEVYEGSLKAGWEKSQFRLPIECINAKTMRQRIEAAQKVFNF